MCQGVSQGENEARVNETEGKSKKRGMKDKGREVGGKRKEDGDNAILTPIRNCRWLQVWSAEMSISSLGYFLPRIVYQRSKYLLSHPFFFDSRGPFDPDLSPRTRTSSYSHVISLNQRSLPKAAIAPSSLIGTSRIIELLAVELVKRYVSLLSHTCFPG